MRFFLGPQGEPCESRKVDRHDRKHRTDLLKELQHFFDVNDDDEEDPDDAALRENIMELFCDARDQGKTLPVSDWKRLGIGYGPVGGQQFPEACALDKTVKGPQGEILYVDAPCRVADSSVASGTDRSLFDIFADRELFPYVVEKCDGGDAADPEEKLRYRVRFADGGKNDEYEFDADELDELDDEEHERLRSLAGGSIIPARAVRSVPSYNYAHNMKSAMKAGS